MIWTYRLIDGSCLVQVEFYNKKSAQYTKDKKELEKAILNSTNANPKNAEAALDVYKLSQKASLLFEKAKPEIKRELIKLVFDDLTLDGNTVEYT